MNGSSPRVWGIDINITLRKSEGYKNRKNPPRK
jgi:hypothetical protein